MKDLLYTSVNTDRRHQIRGDQAKVIELKRGSSVRVLVLWRDLSLVNDDPMAPAWLDGQIAQHLLAHSPDAIYLGHESDHPLFAVDISSMAADDTGPVLTPQTRFVHLRGHGPQLPIAMGAWLAYARGLVFWHRVNGFCGVCGSPTKIEDAGHVRRCTSSDCGHQTYPRTDCAVIMLVEDGSRILLHRQKIWAPGMWSCMAGFVEPGETLEAAVRREVKEESGVLVDDVRYVNSQPWPFPSSLMVAFTAKAVGGELKPDLNEIEDARWFTLQDLDLFDDRNRQSGQGMFLAVPGSAARHLIETWKNRV